jgi:hypothetical protein
MDPIRTQLLIIFLKKDSNSIADYFLKKSNSIAAANHRHHRFRVPPSLLNADSFELLMLLIFFWVVDN